MPTKLFTDETDKLIDQFFERAQNIAPNKAARLHPELSIEIYFQKCKLSTLKPS